PIQLIGGAAIALISLTGCSGLPGGGEPADPATQQTPASQDTAPSEQSTAQAGPEATSPKASGDAPTVESLGPALLTQDFIVPGTKDKVEASIYSLKVQGEIMELTMTITPHFPHAPADEPLSYYTVLNETSQGPKLLDRENLKEYSTVKEPSSSGLSTLNGTPMLWTGWYAAPQDPIDAIDIQVMDGVPSFRNVPVTR
ncbi:MAG: hypothetical protein Q4P23_10755, partial [Micrococcaceae bacterium]|nr:hypothetical protein [Micrococcaceae bacterium]